MPYMAIMFQSIFVIWFVFASTMKSYVCGSLWLFYGSSFVTMMSVYIWRTYVTYIALMVFSFGLCAVYGLMSVVAWSTWLIGGFAP